MKARKKEMLEVQHPRMTNVFDQRNTNQSQELMDLRSRDLENDSDWYVWRFYVDAVATQVGRLRTLIKELDDKLDEQGAILRKEELNDWVFEDRENKQALLHNVDVMLDLTNKEKQRQLSRSVTEWKEFFAELEASWGYWFPDVNTLMKGPKDETDKTKLRQEASGTSTNAAMRCTQTRKLKQSSFNPTKRNCSLEVASEMKSLAQSSRVIEEERRVVGASNPSDVIKSIWDVKVLPEQSNKGSVKATSKSNRTTASSKSSNAKRVLLLELEAMKKQDEIDEQLAAARRKAEIRKKQEEMDMRIIAEELEIAKLEEETARAKQVLKNDMDSARNEMQLKLTQSQKVTKQLQPSKGPQKCYRTINASSTAMKPSTGAELCERNALSQNNMNEVTDKESHLRNNKELCFGQIDSKSIVGSHLRSNRESVESSSTMTIVKQTQPRHTSSKESSGDRNESLKKRKDERMCKQEEMALLKALDCTTKGKCTMKRWQHEQIKCSDMCPNHGKLQDKCEAHEDSNMTNIESNANKGTSKNLIAEWMWNWPETFFVDNGWQDFRSEILLVDTEQVLEEEIHLVMSEHLVVQTEETLDYRMTETMQEHRSLAFASNNETSEEFSVQLELLQVMAEVSTVLQDVRQGKLFQVTVSYDITLLLEEGNKCYEFVKSYDFVNEQRYTLPEDLNEIVMYQKLCHVAMKHEKPAKSNAKTETQVVNATFGKKTDFDFNESLLEETILSHRNVWNHWIGNGNSGMDAVAQANVIDETQLSNGHRKQSKRRIWKIEHNWNLIHGTEERSQLNGNGTRDDTFWLHDLTDNVSVSRMGMCSLKVPTTASWSDGSCNGPAALFKTMWTRHGSFGKLEVFADLSEPVRNLDEKKLKFCSERSTVNLYKQKRKQNSTALQLFGENSDVATKNDVSVSKKQNAAQRLSSPYKSPPIGCKENIEHKGKNSSRCNVGISLYPLIMMMDDSIISPERRIESLSMERLENELSLTYLPRGQSTLMRKYVAEQILGNCMETFSTHLEIYSLDVEVIMEVELNVLKQFCIIPVKGSREKELVEHNKCRTLTIKIGMMGKTITSNKTTVFWKYFVLCQLVDNNCMVREMDYGLEKHCSRERTQQTTGKHDYEAEDLRKTTMTDDNLRPPVVRLAPMFYESVFREKNRAGNVGASHQQAKKLKFERD